MGKKPSRERKSKKKVGKEAKHFTKEPFIKEPYMQVKATGKKAIYVSKELLVKSHMCKEKPLVKETYMLVKSYW